MTHQPDIIGFQKVLREQLFDLTDINPGYEWSGAGRDDGKEKGEYAPVFFKADLFELLNEGTFWLSKTPEVIGSIGWGAHLPRIVSWVSLEGKSTGNTLYFFNISFRQQRSLWK